MSTTVDNKGWAAVVRVHINNSRGRHWLAELWFYVPLDTK